METAAIEARSSMMKNNYYYSKRNEPIVATGRQPLDAALSSHALPCSDDQFELGAFYEIDHSELPPKSPIQLKAIRVVKVSETTRLDVTVSFPSILALRSCFGSDPASDGSPDMDERFIMSTNHAGRILRRLIPPSQLEAEKHLASFWLLTPRVYEAQAADGDEEEEEEEMKPPPRMGACLLALKLSGVTGWGIRKRVKYIGRHKELPLALKRAKVEYDMEEVKQPKRTRDKKQQKKRKVESSTDRKRRREERTLSKGEDEREKGKRLKGSRERWSAERYSAASQKLLEIMREKKAVLGNPIMRPVLREEARKHVGDTGLLDHLLKHMAGKVVCEGSERFRRRHNAEGAMEYWLEPAELMDTRLQAGVPDPYWIPPPGWKLGDATSPGQCSSECMREIAQLKDLVALLKREMKQLEKEGCKDDAQWEAENGREYWQESYKSLLEKYTKLEEDMAGMSSCLQRLKEEVRLLKEDKDKKKEEAQVVNMDTKEGDSNRNNDGSNVKRAVRRSGFRICKPQGTFLWPDMGASSGITFSGGMAAAAVRPQLLVMPPTEERLVLFGDQGSGGIPTPPSASSATSAPRLRLMPGPPTSPAAPRPAAEIPVVPQGQGVGGPHLVANERSTGSSESFCASAYCHTARAMASPSSLPGGAEEGKKGKEAVVSWGPQEEVCITTDLALATPTTYF